MRRFRWGILIGQLVLLTLALAVPRVDIPQTAFNEADAPVNQATVIVVLGCRSALGELQAAAGATASLLHPALSHSGPAPDMQRPQHVRSHSLLSLLCTLLC